MIVVLRNTSEVRYAGDVENVVVQRLANVRWIIVSAARQDE
jgi:hypothetical protein